MLHEFVPCAGSDDDKIYGEQGNVGDQLSVERAVNCLLQVHQRKDLKECTLRLVISMLV